MENMKLREQFIRDMKLKGFAEGTQKAYLSCVILFVKKYNRNPQELGETEIKEYLFQLSEEGRSKTYINQCYSGLRFLYETTLKRDWESYKIPRSKQKKRLPVALSQQEIYTLITKTKNLKHKAIFSVMYSGGLRVKETTSLKADETKIMTLTLDEFIRRFLLHILSDRYVKVRYYGFLSNSQRKKKLVKCRKILRFRVKKQESSD